MTGAFGGNPTTPDLGWPPPTTCVGASTTTSASSAPACRRVEGVGGEAEALVAFQRALVAGEHFQRELAAAALAGVLLTHTASKRLTHAAPASGGQHGHVVHVQQWPGLEGGIAFKGVDQAHGFIARPGDEAGRQRVRGQVVAQAARASAASGSPPPMGSCA